MSLYLKLDIIFLDCSLIKVQNINAIKFKSLHMLIHKDISYLYKTLSHFM